MTSLHTLLLFASIGALPPAEGDLQPPAPARRIVLSTEGDGLLKVQGAARDVERFCQQWSATIDDLLVVFQDRKDIRIYPVRHVAVSDAADMLDAMFNDRNRQKALIRMLRQKERQDQLAERGAASPAQRVARPVPADGIIAGSDADLTAGAALAAAAGQGYQIRIFADAIGRQLVVNAREQDHYQIAQLLERFDTRKTRALRVIKLEHLAPADVEKLLDNLQNRRHNTIPRLQRNANTRGRPR